MILKWLKNLWAESADSTFILTRIITPVGGLFFTWGFVGHLFMINLQKGDLEEISGQIEWIGTVTENSVGRSPAKHHPLNILLRESQEKYRLRDNFKYDFKRIQDHIGPGDNIKLYMRTEIQSLIGWGQRNDIYIIQKEGKTIFSLEQMTKYLENQMYAFGAFGFICWFLYAMHIYDNRQSKRNGASANKVHNQWRGSV